MTYREIQAQGEAELDAERERKRTPAERRSRERFFGARRWVRRNLPDEHPELAAAAAMSVRMSRGTVTPEAVRKRLEGQGRHHEALREKGIEW